MFAGNWECKLKFTDLKLRGLLHYIQSYALFPLDTTF